MCTRITSIAQRLSTYVSIQLDTGSAVASSHTHMMGMCVCVYMYMYMYMYVYMCTVQCVGVQVCGIYDASISRVQRLL